MCLFFFFMTWYSPCIVEMGKYSSVLLFYGPFMMKYKSLVFVNASRWS